MPETRHRAFTATRKGDAAKNTFEASLSSEYQYLRGYGYEVLSHESSAVDLSRSKDGLPLLLQHDPGRPVGMVENIRIESKKLRARLRFFTTEAGAEAATMVAEGLRTLSIGYVVDDAQQTGTRDNMPVFTVSRWTPFECSLVSIPADPSVGIGRSSSLNSNHTMTTATEATEISALQTRAREAERANDINAIAAMIPGGPELAQRAISAGDSVEAFSRAMIRHLSTKPVATADIRSNSAPAADRYSLRNLILASVDPAKYGHLCGYEREQSSEIERRFSMRAEGSFIPASVLRRDLATGLNGGSSVIEDTMRGDMLLRVLRPQARVIQAGARVLSGLSGNLRIPRQTAGAEASWQTEQGEAPETNVELDDLELSPRRLTAYIDVSKQQLIQSSVEIEAMLRDDLTKAADQLIDFAAINGSGIGHQPLGIRNTPGVGLVVGGANGAAFNWGHVVDLESRVAETDVAMNRPGYLTNAATRAWLRKTQRGPDMDFILEGKVQDEPLNSWPLLVSNNVPKNLSKGTSNGICSSLIFSGDWSELLIAQFGELDVIVDPYTFASTATVRITINQFVDIAVRQPKAFAIMEDGLTTA
ncbi:HK97 family phage major capsid protein [Variovorax paradoxus]|uniref:phage major capsid protein n=1 Tax=Variovorax paradoxus TaxID=34073 RepID=UPI00277D6CB8|nr:phage major capsid protein [Variovorax paradoxus]MDP9966884.1 HK97 family phage major capsid protein [Variovorax paradoxus]